MSLYGSGSFDTPLVFPAWATDLNAVSKPMRDSWQGEISIRQKYHHYFSGLVFEERIESEDNPDPPLAYPVGLNIIKMLCLAITDTIFGEWTERVVSWEAHQDDAVTAAEESALLLANAIMDASDINTTLWECDLDRNVYGGGAFKISVDISSYPYVKWVRVPLVNFFPIWNPDNANELIEVFVILPMTSDQAREQYGIDNPSADVVYRVEHWTRKFYTNTVDGHRIDAYSGNNPWGVVPFVYIPRYRTSHWWGDSLVEDLIKPQNEINELLADIGETVSYNAFPIRYGFNLPNAFNTTNYPIAPNALWDMGKRLSEMAKPEVGMLESKNPMPEGTLEYVQLLFDFTLYTAMVPPIALGMESGGSQRSGITVEIRLASLVRSMRRARSYMATGLQRAMKITAIIMKHNQFPGIPVRAVEQMLLGSIYPSFASILPRDQASVVDEINKALSGKIPVVSLETAVKKLGYGGAEVSRIIAMIQDTVLGELLKPKAPEPKPAEPDARAKADNDEPDRDS